MPRARKRSRPPKRQAPMTPRVDCVFQFLALSLLMLSLAAAGVVGEGRPESGPRRLNPMGRQAV